MELVRALVENTPYAIPPEDTSISKQVVSIAHEALFEIAKDLPLFAPSASNVYH